MMVLIYTSLLITIILGWLGKEKASFIFCAITIALIIPWFLFHVYSQEYGFSMPWINL